MINVFDIHFTKPQILFFLLCILERNILAGMLFLISELNWQICFKKHDCLHGSPEWPGGDCLLDHFDCPLHCLSATFQRDDHEPFDRFSNWKQIILTISLDKFKTIFVMWGWGERFWPQHMIRYWSNYCHVDHVHDIGPCQWPDGRSSIQG